MLHFYTPLKELFYKTYSDNEINPNDVDDHFDDEAVIKTIIISLKHVSNEKKDQE